VAERLFVNTPDKNRNVKNAVDPKFVNITDKNHDVKNVVERLFVNMADTNQHVKNVAALKFANMGDKNRIVKNAVEHNYVKATIVKQRLLKNTMDIAYHVAFKYVLKFKYHATIKPKKEM